VPGFRTASCFVLPVALCFACSGERSSETSGGGGTERHEAARPAGMSVGKLDIGAGTWSSNSAQPTAKLDNLDIPAQ